MLGNLFRRSTAYKQLVNKKNKTLKLTVLPQAEAKGSTSTFTSIDLRLRLHCQFITLIFVFV